jgi:tetratricopeptide (TPR) repeat protein
MIRTMGVEHEARALRRAAGRLALAAVLAGCSPESVVGNGQLPPDTPDPAATRTTAGALAAYHGTLIDLRQVYGRSGSPSSDAFVVVSGLLSDELISSAFGAPPGVFDNGISIDSRDLPESLDPQLERGGLYTSTYANLHLVRQQANEAIGLLTHYAVGVSPAVTGEAYAAKAYAEVFLADLFCSGIPLSTIDFNGDYTLEPGSSTQDVYQHAIALFDTALSLSADSVHALNLARVGKGRALLALGRYADAAAAVAEVPDDFRYDAIYGTADVNTGQSVGATNFMKQLTASQPFGIVADSEAGEGLDYRASRDPRAASSAHGTNGFGTTIFLPTKYSLDGSSPIPIASGVEARLIEAEAALNANDASWLDKLNTLRTTGELTGVDTVVVDVDTTDVGGTTQIDTTFRYDTLWVAGTGGVAKLGPLQDPGTADARVDLLFRERAFWLFLTGHRLGDMRRLIRQYGRTPEALFPNGAYRGGSGHYGTSVNAPIPAAERAANPLFTGCINRGA